MDFAAVINQCILEQPFLTAVSQYSIFITQLLVCTLSTADNSLKWQR